MCISVPHSKLWADSTPLSAVIYARGGVCDGWRGPCWYRSTLAAAPPAVWVRAASAGTCLPIDVLEWTMLVELAYPSRVGWHATWPCSGTPSLRRATNPRQLTQPHHIVNNLPTFDWHVTWRGPCAIAELLVTIGRRIKAKSHPTRSFLLPTVLVVQVYQSIRRACLSVSG